MANTNLELTSLDFDSLKNAFKAFISAYPNFQDYNFDGSNLSVVLDVLAYNTYKNNFYLNMVASEMFLDTAQQRDSVVLRAKELNYLPRSFTSSYANINLAITSNSANLVILTIPKGTSFTGRSGSNNYTFVTNENVVVPVGNNSTFYANNLLIYEGIYVTEAFTVNYAAAPQRFVLANPRVDTTSIAVMSIENAGANVIPYTFASSLLDLKTTSPVFFLQGAENSQYEIFFGDNTVGRKPSDGAVLSVEYRVSNGELPNGIDTFSINGPVSGQQNVAIIVNAATSGGSINEDINSIKYYAPLSFATQDRAVTIGDYESLLKLNFPEIKAVSVYGGEDITPPQYGKVFVSVVIANIDGLPESKKITYTNFLSPRTGVTITPVFVLPDYIYASVNSIIKYNINVTPIGDNDVISLATSTVQSFNTTNLDNFKANFYYSNLVEAIDSTDQSFVSNETTVSVFKKILPALNSSQNITFSFNIPIDNSIPPIPAIHPETQEHAITSTQFVFDGKLVELEDDSQGNIRLVALQAGSHKSLYNIGTVDYSTGTITLTNLIVNSYIGDSLRIYGKPASLDFSSTQNQVLAISTDEINITPIQVRI